MVHSLDDAVGSLLDALDEEGIAEDTVIILLGQGGNIHCGLEETDSSGGKYMRLSRATIRCEAEKVAFMGRQLCPGRCCLARCHQPGSRSDVRIQATDLYPTILKMLNIQRPDDMSSMASISAKLSAGRRCTGVRCSRMYRVMETLHTGFHHPCQHHHEWKLIRTFHYGNQGQHQYWPTTA